MSVDRAAPSSPSGRASCSPRCPVSSTASRDASPVWDGGRQRRLQRAAGPGGRLGDAAAWCAAGRPLDAERLVTLGQIHGARDPRRHRRATPGGARAPARRRSATAMRLVTNVAGPVLMTLHADCQPTPLRRSRHRRRPGGCRRPRRLARHGRRHRRRDARRDGRRLRHAAEDVHVALGPAIGACCYEVGEEVAAGLASPRRRRRGRRPRSADGSILSIFPRRGQSLLLGRAGVPPHHIDVSRDLHPLRRRANGSLIAVRAPKRALRRDDRSHGSIGNAAMNGESTASLSPRAAAADRSRRTAVAASSSPIVSTPCWPTWPPRLAEPAVSPTRSPSSPSRKPSIGRRSMRRSLSGLRHFGENRVQDAAASSPSRCLPAATLHLIGQLQSNKARPAVALFDIIESVDRPSLIDALEKEAAASRRSRSPSSSRSTWRESRKKPAAHPEQRRDLMGRLVRSPWLLPRGLMTMAPLVDGSGRGPAGLCRAASAARRSAARLSRRPISARSRWA